MTLHEFTKLIGAALGEGWTYDEKENHWGDGQIKHFATLQHTDGYGICIWGENGRLEINGRYPEYTDAEGFKRTIHPNETLNHYNESRPKITVSSEKSTEQIAREIERRFLPVFVPLWQACKETAANWENHYRGMIETAQTLNCLPGVKFHKDSDRHGYVNLGDYTGTLDVNGTNSITLQLRSLSVDQVKDILRIVQEGTL